MKKSLSPVVDVMEARVVPSAATPLISRHALQEVARDVRAIMGTLARTGDTARASARLTGLSSRVPSGPEELAPAWRIDLGLYDPHRAASVTLAERRILGDLHRYVRGGGVASNPPASGSGSTTPTSPGQGTGGTGGPVSSPSLDSVRIQNDSGLALTVTVHLYVSQVQQPFITETIPAQGNPTVLFDFGTATDAFMTIEIRRADGGQSPPPFTGVSFDQPMGGYDRELFTISVFGGYFNISPP
jgi:hypothetical protein